MQPGKTSPSIDPIAGYDYASTGMYFVTICAYQRQCLFGEIANGEMRLNELGQIGQSHWLKLPRYHLHLRLDALIVMPNHMHGIPEIIRGFKTFSARSINSCRKMRGTPVGQRNYYEHIIRNEESLHFIRQYIDSNPRSGQEDQLHPDCPSKW